MSQAQAAGVFGVSESTVNRLVSRRRRDPNDDLPARTPPGQAASIPVLEHQELWKQLEASPAATAAEHAEL